MRPLPSFLASALLIAVTAPCAMADVFESGDIVVPGNRIVDSWGNANGCFYRIRSGVVTRWFESPSFRGPRDLVVDSEGRLVFLASPSSRNVNDAALFRIDPATGVLERLFYFPYIVAPGDTIPNGAEDATGFYNFRQSLHLEKSFSIEINDDENNGWPQISSPEAYGFSVGTTYPTPSSSTAYRFRSDQNTCEVGVPLHLLPVNTSVLMASDGRDIYYGWGHFIGKTQAASHVNLHLDGDWGTLDASATVNPKNEIIQDGYVFDNTNLPNVNVDCGTIQDSNVPLDGSSFRALSMSALGVLNGQLYALSNSVATNSPYVFSLTMRAPYLNPYNCQWSAACQGNGPHGFWLEDGTPTASSWASPDGSGLLGLGNGRIKQVTTSGGYTELAASAGDVAFSGRPVRWSASSAKASAIAATSTSGPQVLVVRADARVHVLLTDAQGRRVGFDAAGGEVNEFGDRAALATGPGGWPRLIVLRDPEAGTFAVETAALDAGDWDVKAYLAHESAGGVLRATSGSAAGAGSEVRGLHVGQPLELTWYASPAGVGDDTGEAGFVSVGPVPSRGAVRLAYRVAMPDARVRLDIFDLLGRRVATPLDATVAAGAHTLTWDGTDAAGQRLARGIYVARLELDGRRDSRRIVLTD